MPQAAAPAALAAPAPRPASPVSPVAPGILQAPSVPLVPGALGSPKGSPRSPTGSVRSEGNETKRAVKTLFVQCFKEDLFQERQLLMSQINNLFKLRNNGEALQYKEREGSNDCFETSR